MPEACLESAKLFQISYASLNLSFFWQDDDAQEDGMSKAEVLRVLRGHMNDIKVSGFQLLCFEQNYDWPSTQCLDCIHTMPKALEAASHSLLHHEAPSTNRPCARPTLPTSASHKRTTCSTTMTKIYSYILKVALTAV